MQISANGGLVEYDRRGSGAPLVLLHGGEADMAMWRRVVPLLEERFTVVNYNQRDTGASQHPGGDYGMADLADDTAALIEALELERAHIVGTSYGGVIAQELALRHPERVDHLVLAVTTRGPTKKDDGGPPRLGGRDEETGKVVSAAIDGDADASRKLNELFFSPEALEREPGLLDELPQIRYTRPPDLGRRRMDAVLGYSAHGQLGRIEAPTLVLAGAADRILSPNEPWEMANEIPGATLVRLGGVGHVWSLEAPERVVRIIEAFTDGRL